MAKMGEASLQLEVLLRVADMNNSASVAGRRVSWVFALPLLNYKLPSTREVWF